MGNLISFIQEIFMMKEDNSTKVGLSVFKEEAVTPVEKKQTQKVFYAFSRDPFE